MKLTILNKDKLELDGFCEWFVEILKDALRDSLDADKLKARDAKLNNALSKTMPQTLTTEVAIKLAINNLTWKKISANKYQISIDDRARIYGTNNTVLEVAKYIEYGGKGLMPLFLFRPLFRDVSNDLDRFYSIYLERVGG